MLKNVLSAAGIALVFTAAGVAAQQTTYRCEMNSRSGNGFVSKTMFFSLASAQGTGAVYDGLIHAMHKAPIPAQVTKRRDNVWRFKWRVDDVPSSNTGKVSLRYAAILNTTKGQVTLSGGIGGFDNDISGRGRCEVAKG